MEKIKFFIVLISISFALTEDDFTSTPVVLWHGMGVYSDFIKKISQDYFLCLQFHYDPIKLFSLSGDSCCFPFSMGMIKKLIEAQLNDTVYVKSLEIGGSLVRDYESSYFIHPQKQVQYYFPIG